MWPGRSARSCQIAYLREIAPLRYPTPPLAGLKARGKPLPYSAAGTGNDGSG